MICMTDLIDTSKKLQVEAHRAARKAAIVLMANNMSLKGVASNFDSLLERAACRYDAIAKRFDELVEKGVIRNEA